MANHTAPGSRAIGIRPATNVFHGLRYAKDVGRAPDTFITLNLSEVGVDDDHAPRFFSDLRARFRRAWRYQRDRAPEIGPLDEVGSHENPNDIRHVHWIVRVPPQLRPWLGHTLAKLIQKMTHRRDLGSALEIKEVVALGGLAKYILKGVRPDGAAYFHMEAVDQGRVFGRRTFVSRTLGFSARKAAGWKRKRRGKAA